MKNQGKTSCLTPDSVQKADVPESVGSKASPGTKRRIGSKRDWPSKEIGTSAIIPPPAQFVQDIPGSDLMQGHVSDPATSNHPSSSTSRGHGRQKSVREKLLGSYKPITTYPTTVEHICVTAVGSSPGFFMFWKHPKGNREDDLLPYGQRTLCKLALVTRLGHIEHFPIIVDMDTKQGSMHVWLDSAAHRTFRSLDLLVAFYRRECPGGELPVLLKRALLLHEDVQGTDMARDSSSNNQDNNLRGVKAGAPPLSPGSSVKNPSRLAESTTADELIAINPDPNNYNPHRVEYRNSPQLHSRSGTPSPALVAKFTLMGGAEIDSSTSTDTMPEDTDSPTNVTNAINALDQLIATLDDVGDAFPLDSSLTAAGFLRASELPNSIALDEDGLSTASRASLVRASMSRTRNMSSSSTPRSSLSFLSISTQTSISSAYEFDVPLRELAPFVGLPAYEDSTADGDDSSRGIFEAMSKGEVRDVRITGSWRKVVNWMDNRFEDLVKCFKTEGCQMRALGMSGCFSNLKPESCILIEGLMQAIAGCKTMQTLDLSHNRFGDVEIPLVCQALMKSKIVALEFSANHITTKGAEAISKYMASNANLKEISLAKSPATLLSKGRQVTGDLTPVLMQLKNNISIVAINLASCRLGYEGTVYVCEILKTNATLKRLNLNNNALGPEGGMAIMEALQQNERLEEIDLGWNGLGSEAGAATPPMIVKSTTLKKLIMCNNSIIFDAGKGIADALITNMFITEIDFSQNKLGDIAMNAFATVFENNEVLVSVDLSRNPISQETALFMLIKLGINTTIEKLNLSRTWGYNTKNQFQQVQIEGRTIADEILQLLTRMNGALSQLNLMGNSIGFENLKQPMTINSSLEHFNVLHCDLDEASRSTIIESWASRSTDLYL